MPRPSTDERGFAQLYQCRCEHGTPSIRDIAAGTEEPEKLSPQSFENGYSDVIISVTFAYEFFWGLIGFFEITKI